MNISELKNRPNLFRLYSILMMLSDGEKVETSYTELSELSGFHRNSLKVQITQLEVDGFIIIDRITHCAKNSIIVQPTVQPIVQHWHNKTQSISECNTDGYDECKKQNITNIVQPTVQPIVQPKEDPPSSLSPIPPISTTTEEYIYDNKYLSIYNKDNLSTDARTREDGPIHKWIVQLKTERYWQELICMKHKILPADLLRYLKDYERDIIIRGKQMHTINDVKHYFDYWLPQAIKQRKSEGRDGFIRLIEEKRRVEQQIAEEDEKRRVR